MDEVFALQLGGISFEGGAGSDGFYVRAITGWDTLPDARGSLDAIPGADGSFMPSDVHRDSRVISLDVVAAAGSRAEVEALRAKLMTLLKAKALMRVSDELGTLSADVRVEAITPSDPGPWAAWIDFTIDLIAPDPIRYRDTVMVGPVGLPSREGGLLLPSAFPWNFGVEAREVATVVNDGAVPVFPIITLSGSAASMVVHGGPSRIEFGVWAGVLVLDCRERRAWLNGTDVTIDLLRRDWPSVPAGATADFFFEAGAPSPDTTLTVEYRIGAW